MGRRNDWVVIPDFEGHEINSRGEIRHIQSGNILKTSINQSGARYVSIRNTTYGKYQNMALSVLIAAAFCPGRTPQTDTVQHLDGNTLNVSADNLMWSSRFNAIAYHKEINEDRYNVIRHRVVDGNGREFKTIADAARATGALPSAIEYAARYNDSLAHDENINFVHRIWPGGHTFRSA